jgi:hypothetical protein
MAKITVSPVGDPEEVLAHFDPLPARLIALAGSTGNTISNSGD